ncbi:MgtC/SapB family protein [Effusibacillus pohliae]|uniref:MgtC/SapB family protein n=1 Tax=Effusibacillus pohliae TaxID=232270 RepID=UPI00037583F0|nr:MgtC/SapB family protein [Effusibacillus pohliae]
MKHVVGRRRFYKGGVILGNIWSLIGITDSQEFWGIMIRMVAALVIGAIIGLERQRYHQVKSKARVAGIRTYSLVCFGSCLFGIASQYGFEAYVLSSGTVTDPGRIAAQVVAGVGFLGAGAIIKEQGQIKGLTTAAGLWVSAALGIVLSSKIFLIGIIAAIMTYITLDLPKLFPKLFEPKVDDDLAKETSTKTDTLEVFHRGRD